MNLRARLRNGARAFAGWALRAARASGGFLLRVFRRVGGLFRRRRKAHEDPMIAATARVTLDPASAPVEAIHQFAQARRARIIGLAGVERDSGASLVARALAARCVNGRRSALLIDAASQDPLPNDDRPERDPLGYDVLRLRPEGAELLPMRDIERLRHIFQQDHAAYDVIIVDMPAVRYVAGSALPATIIANACDALFLVCLTGAVTRLLLEETVGALRAVQAPLTGLVVNRREQPTLGAEIAREARRLRKRAPKLSARIENWALSSELLDVHA
jgi:Mrp family chromosome partitioning ATPase